MTFEELGIKTKLGVRRYSTTCPECSKDRKKKNSPCLTVNNEPGNQWYNCNHCNFSGNLEQIGKYDQVKKRSKLPVEPREFTIIARKWMESRGISVQTAKKLQLYEVSQKGKTLIGWPYYMSMTLVNVKFLDLSWKPGAKFPKWFQLPKDLGTRIVPFGMNRLDIYDENNSVKKGTYILLSEGEIDSATWIECGYINSLSVPQGAPSLKSKNFEKEFSYMHDPYVKAMFKDVPLFYLSGDADEPGRKLVDHLGSILDKEKCRIIKYPKGYKDINEVFHGNEAKKLPALGKEGVYDCFKNAVAFPIKGIIRPSQVIDGLRKLREKGYEPGLKCGVEEVDKRFTLKQKLLYEFIGIPSSGKSTVIRWYLIKIIQHNPDMDLKFAMFSPESRPIEREYAKIAETLTGMSIEKDAYNAMSDEVYRKAMIFIEKHFFIIYPDKKNFENFGNKINDKRINTLDSLFEYIAYLKKTENIFGFVLDPWNKVEHERPRNKSETEFAGEQLDKILSFSDYYDLAAILLIHPVKTESVGMNYRMPTLYSAKGSSAYFERADVGVIVHRNKMKKKKETDVPDDATEEDKWEQNYAAPTIIKVEKIKQEEIGLEGTVKMKFKNNQFEVVEKGQSKPVERTPKPKKEEPPHPDLFSESRLFNEEDEEDSLPF